MMIHISNYKKSAEIFLIITCVYTCVQCIIHRHHFAERERFNISLLWMFGVLFGLRRD